MGSGILNQKGQISIEFILILVFGLVYIIGIIGPVVDESAQATVDIKSVSDTKVSAMKLANALDEAGTSSGNMKKTIQLLIPKDSEIICNTTVDEEGIDFIATVSPIGGGWNPDDSKCTTIEDPPGTTVGFKCSSKIGILSDTAAEITDCPIMTGPLFRTIVVEKTAAGISVNWS